MLSFHYIRLAFRQLLRRKLTSFIHLIGLSLGVSSCILILLYVFHERSYDRWHRNYESIYRVNIDVVNKPSNEVMSFAPVSGTVAEVLKEYPSVQSATRIIPPFTEAVQINDGADKIFYENRFYWADPNIFEIFTFSFLAGVPATALGAPMDLVISRSIAEKYFGITEDFSKLIDKTLRKDTTVYRITGVIEDAPDNSVFQPHFLASLKEYRESGLIKTWHATAFHTFVKLNEEVDAKVFEKEISRLADNFVGNEIQENLQEYHYSLQHLTDIHLFSERRYELGENNSWSSVRLLGVVAFVILFLACINFVNLSTAEATTRIKEVGVRKTSGAQRYQLIGQLLIETLMIAFCTLPVSLIILSIVLPWFNQLADKSFILYDLWSSGFWVWMLVIVFITGLMAGLYPSLVISRLSPEEALREKSRQGMSWKTGYLFRNVLVSAQFGISIILLIAVFVISGQIKFLKNQDPGFHKEQMLIVHAPGTSTFSSQYLTIRNELEKIPDVQAVSFTGNIPGRTFINNKVSLQNDKSRTTDMQLLPVDQNFLYTYDIPLVAGRNLSELIPEDLTDNVLINESAVKVYGWSSPEEAIGQQFDGGWGKVVGVIKDFLYHSRHHEVLPLEMYFSQRGFRYVSMRLKSSQLDKTIAEIKSKWNVLLPEIPFSFSFLDEEFNRLYHQEERLSRLLRVFAFLAISIACLGLFGLSTFAVARRSRELSVRKVLGASAIQMINLLFFDFLKPVFVGFFLAIPIAYLIMHQWLEGYVSRITLSWHLFMIISMVVLFSAILTIAFQSLKVIFTNPVNHLKNNS